MTNNNRLSHCSFCGKHKDDVVKLIVGDDVAICDKCITLCNDLITEEINEELTDSPNSSSQSLYPEDIKNYLDQYVVGQDLAKQTLCVAVSNHYKRIKSSVEIQKSNVLILGHTGSGKTLLARTIAKYLDVPFIIADATSLTESGYVGLDVEHMVSLLVQEANGDVQKAQSGIVFVDEIDKISRKSESASITRDVSGEGVQQAMLKLIEGTKCSVSAPGKRRNPQGDMIEVDTTNILFIASGAFVGLSEIINNRLKGSTIGFSGTISHNYDVSLSEVTPSDLIKYGLIPEFVGRFGSIVHVDKLDKNQLKSILTDVKNSYMDQYIHLFKLDGISLSFTTDAIDQIVDQAFTTKTGARGLQNQIEKILLPHMFNVKYYLSNNLKELVIDKDMVLNPRKKLL